ncbi:MAG: Na+/H+ antiporter NhaC family protein, partial [Bacillus sp. (in: firmicutes)]
IQGLIPYGAQLLVAAGVAKISPMSILPYSYYPALIGICAIIAILTGFPKLKDEEQIEVSSKILLKKAE